MTNESKVPTKNKDQKILSLLPCPKLEHKTIKNLNSNSYLTPLSSETCLLLKALPLTQQCQWKDIYPS